MKHPEEPRRGDPCGRPYPFNERRGLVGKGGPCGGQFAM